MSEFHIDAVLGPERNPRQGFGAQDILRWQEQWREHWAGRRAAKTVEQQELQVERQKPGGMDEFFAPADPPPEAWKDASHRH